MPVNMLRSRLDFFAYQTQTSTPNQYLHLKTNQPMNDIMQTVEFKGYEYGSSKPINSIISYYPYSVSGVTSAGYSGTHQLGVYKSVSGHAVVTIFVASTYFLGILLNQYGPGPQGMFTLSITATALSAAATGAF